MTILSNAHVSLSMLSVKGPCIGSKLTDAVSSQPSTKVKSGTAVKGYYSGVRGVMFLYNGVRGRIFGVIVGLTRYYCLIRKINTSSIFYFLT